MLPQHIIAQPVLPRRLRHHVAIAEHAGKHLESTESILGIMLTVKPRLDYRRRRRRRGIGIHVHGRITRAVGIAFAVVGIVSWCLRIVPEGVGWIGIDFEGEEGLLIRAALVSRVDLLPSAQPCQRNLHVAHDGFFINLLSGSPQRRVAFVTAKHHLVRFEFLPDGQLRRGSSRDDAIAWRCDLAAGQAECRRSGCEKGAS